MTERKVAIVGTARTSVGLAPVDDPEWEIWCSAPGCRALKRYDRWYEVHCLGDYDYEKLAQGYLTFLTGAHDLFMAYPDQRYPQAQLFDRDPLVEKFGPHFFTGSVAWLFAQALYEGVKTIGIWGVDASHTDEWRMQRAGIFYFIWWAREHGVDVIVPTVSKLNWPNRYYGSRRAEEEKALYRRLEEMKNLHAGYERALETAKRNLAMAAGAIDALEDTILELYGRDCDTARN